MESALTVIPFGKITAPHAVKIYEGREVVKVFTDPLFDDFRIYKTGGHRLGFWEEEPSKVQKLIDAFKAGHNLKNALIYSGVKEMAWYRFIELYPAFRDIKTACEANTSFGAMNTVQTGLKENAHLAYRYIRERGDLNFIPAKVGDEKPVQPTVNVGVQVNNNFDENKLEAETRTEALEILSPISAESAGVSGEGMETVV